MSTPMQRWYLQAICNSKFRCEECGQPLNFRKEEIAYGSQAHILPKEFFKSIKTHPANRLELGRWCCHGQYDSSWDNASKMKVWPKAKQIMLTILIPLLPAQEYRRLPLAVQEEYETLNR